jgi:hypothetical protein
MIMQNPNPVLSSSQDITFEEVVQAIENGYHVEVEAGIEWWGHSLTALMKDGYGNHGGWWGNPSAACQIKDGIASHNDWGQELKPIQPDNPEV